MTLGRDFLPRQDVPIAGREQTTNPFYVWFQGLERLIAQGGADVAGLQAQIDALKKAIAELPDSEVVLHALGSIMVDGVAPDYFLSLQGDIVSPDNTYYYGTGPDGAKGWHAVADALAMEPQLTMTVGADGVVTFDLATLPDTGIGAALVKITRDDYGRVEGTEAATTDDLSEGATNLYFTDERADARIEAAKADPDGIASLQDGKLDPGQLPALAITETFVVNTEAAMLALDCEQGDVAVRPDLNQSLILTAEPASTLSNWQELLTPTSPVTSVFGRVGSITAATGDYTPAQVGAEPAITSGTAAQYWRGDKSWRDFATDVRAALLTGLSTAANAAIAATDTVLQAFGKLQAQIAANASVRTSGTYTPTVTGVSNVAAASGDVCNWCRVDGGFVVSGLVRVTPSAANATCVASISLPFLTNFTNNTDCGGPATGKAVGVSTYDNGQVTATGGSTTLAINFYPGTTNQYTLRFSAVVPIL